MNERFKNYDGLTLVNKEAHDEAHDNLTKTEPQILKLTAVLKISAPP